MTNKNLSITTLKKHLKTASHEQLVSDIADLFSRFESVRDYYQTKLAPEDTSAVVKKYKAIIKNEFLPARGYGEARLSVARKAVMDYKKIGPDPASLADLMLYYVEVGVAYTNAYGDINEAFYSSMETMYLRAVEFIVKHNLEDVFEARCKKIVEDTDGIGWGFPGTLNEIFTENFKSW